MAEIDNFPTVRNGRAARTLVSFPEPGVLQFTCQSEEDAENLYRDIRVSLPDSWFYMPSSPEKLLS